MLLVVVWIGILSSSRMDELLWMDAFQVWMNYARVMRSSVHLITLTTLINIIFSVRYERIH